MSFNSNDGWANPAENGDSFDTAEMSDALYSAQTEKGDNAESVTDAAAAGYTAAKDGWVKPQAYKYDELADNATHEWDGNAKVYEFDGELGDIGPEFPDLELQLFGDSAVRKSEGIDFSK